jgi:Protein of unknown function (DUF3352)
MEGPRISAVVAVAAVAALALAGCGGGGGNVDVGPAAAVPANTPFYIEATVQPTGSAEEGAKAAAGKILDTSDPGPKLQSLITQSAQADEKPGETFNWQEDVEPWLGEQVGVFYASLSDNDGTAVVESKDNRAALDALNEDVKAPAPGTPKASRSYNGASYELESDGTAFGAVGDFIVSGPEDGFKAAVDALNGDSLGDSGDFKDALGDLPDDRLAAFYSVPKNFVDALPPDQLRPNGKSLFEKFAGDSLDEPITGDVTASADKIELEFTGGSTGSDTPQSSLLAAVPATAWLAFGAGDLGDNLKRAVDQLKDADIPNFETVLSQIEAATGANLDELTAALGDAALYVQGTTQGTVSGALVIRTDDAELTGRLLGQLQSLLQAGSTGARGVKPLTLSGGGTGFQFSDPTSTPQPVEIAQQGDKLVIGYGAGSAQQALQPAQPLSSSSQFTSAEDQVSSSGMDLFLSFAPVFQLAQATGSNLAQAQPYIGALDYLAAGTDSEDGHTQLKAVLGLK